MAIAAAPSLSLSNAMVAAPSTLTSAFHQNRSFVMYGALKAFPSIQQRLEVNKFPTRQLFCLPRIVCASAPETLEKVQKIVATQLAVEPSTVTPSSKFSELGADSLDTVEIVMALEEEYKITIEDEGAEKISTVQDAADIIQDIISRQASSV